MTGIIGMALAVFGVLFVVRKNNETEPIPQIID
jgi:hypothetical protein